MKTSDEAIEVIHSFEGFRAQRYICPAGKPTIGWGFTASVLKGTAWEGLPPNAPPMPRIVAEAIFAERVLPRFERHVLGYDDEYDWEQHEFDAMVSFAYNVGSIDRLTKNGQRTKSEIAQAMMRYVNPGTSFERGLRIRRYAEQQLFLHGEYLTRDEAARILGNA